jgi:hypothetical protein
MFDPKDNLTITQDGDLLFAKAVQDGIETVWDRHEAQQPQCGFCDMGLSCRICIMGPCRVDPFGEGPQTGVCGADADIIVARNLCRMVAAGAASHSDHGRDLVEVLAGVADGTAPGYKIRDEAKLRRLAEEYGRHRRKRQGGALALPASWRGHDGRLRHAPKGHQAGGPRTRKTAGGVGKVQPDTPGHRPGNLGNDAPHPHGGGQQLAEPAAAGHAQRPVRRLGRVHDRHRSVRHPFRRAHPAAHHRSTRAC